MPHNPYITADGDRLDQLCQKQYGQIDHIAKVMDANPGISEFEIFPSGIKITFPEFTNMRVNEKRLWD